MQPLKHWYVQSTGLRRHAAEDRILAGLAESSGTFNDFGVVPFTNEITGWEVFAEVPGFVHCSTKALRILTDETIPASEIFVGAPDPEIIRGRMLAGIFYDHKAFDQAVYMKAFTLSSTNALLNHDARVEPVSELIDYVWPVDTFVKPTSDLKMFKGGVVRAGYTLRQFVHEDLVDVSFYPMLEAGATAMYAPVKSIEREYRFFVVGGEVITGSMYMYRGHVQYYDEIPVHIAQAANQMATLYHPAYAFTMDLGTSDLDIKIVEYNCINCSGLYHADIGKLARVLAGG